MIVLQARYGKLLTAVLLVQAGLYYAVAARSEWTPSPPPLARFPRQLGDWRMTREYPMEPEVQKVLRADDTVSRDYFNTAQPALASLFVAFFKTQRYGQTPHSPKHCLPGAGWAPEANNIISISVPGRPQPIEANRYVVARGEDRMLVIYWYQSYNRVVASEYWARFWLVVDAARYRRSDTSIVRVMVPVVEGDVAAASRTGVAFVQAAFHSIVAQLPQ
jgi:EpsI family protein